MAHNMKRGSDDCKACPVKCLVDRYGMPEKDMLDMVRLNWRMAVLGVIASDAPEGTNYNRVRELTSLNSKTLTIILKGLTPANILNREDYRDKKRSAHVTYLLTGLGKEIVRSSCPLLCLARKAK